MKRLSTPLKLLMGGSIVVAVVAILALVAVALRGREQEATTKKQSAEAATAPELQQEITPSVVKRPSMPVRPRDGKLREPEIRHMPRGVGITTSPSAGTEPVAPVDSPPDAPRRFIDSKMPIQKAIHEMELTTEQSVEIEKFERDFKLKAAERMREGDDAMRAAGMAIREAMAANDSVMMTDARKNQLLAVQKKLETLRDLSWEYVDGLRPVLTPQQIAEAEEFLKQPQVHGVSVAVPLQGTGAVDPESPDRVIHKVIPLRKLPDQQQEAQENTPDHQ